MSLEIFIVTLAFSTNLLFIIIFIYLSLFGATEFVVDLYYYHCYF